MVKIGIIQTKSYRNNKVGISSVSRLLKNLGKKETDLVCLPEQWLQDNRITDYDKEFLDFKKIARDFSMTIIPGAFYERIKHRMAISSPIIGPEGEIVGRQEKIHPFDYERNLVKPGREAKIFNTSCKFGVIICYDMVFPDVANTLVKKGAEVLISPSRIVKRGINPWQMYVQVRALENRVPILAANVNNHRFGGNSIIVDLVEKNKVVIPKITHLRGENATAKEFNLLKYNQIRKTRFSDERSFK
ncbi:carbon-nitrogen hydrolase family protein [Nitrosopumilus sp. K4]|uniref:carbon-nitrogen hydrolase family protein n=1 Tax=Nitrosopumilus sp. K4 TaxID=2795383 RepID=UPI001BA7BC73|nr:carbon-nitrogen hydrolase family protein [Nitrosopumilus sp. K4]QUC63850.1 carbon-nitrogen hydrolase family protein [Nitrosopumilus sp. K4]